MNISIPKLSLVVLGFDSRASESVVPSFAQSDTAPASAYQANLSARPVDLCHVDTATTGISDTSPRPGRPWRCLPSGPDERLPCRGDCTGPCRHHSGRAGRVSSFCLSTWAAPGKKATTLSANKKAARDLLASGLQLEAPGIEPVAPSPQAIDGKHVVETAPETLAQTLAREVEKCPDLARVADAWPALPEHVRQTILTIVASAAATSPAAERLAR
mgnify:CR=1 FL=1